VSTDGRTCPSAFVGARRSWSTSDRQESVCCRSCLTREHHDWADNLLRRLVLPARHPELVSDEPAATALQDRWPPHSARPILHSAIRPANPRVRVRRCWNQFSADFNCFRVSPRTFRTFPNQVGTDMKTAVSLVGDDLTTTIPRTTSGRSSVVVWKRANRRRNQDKRLDGLGYPKRTATEAIGSRATSPRTARSSWRHSKLNVKRRRRGAAAAWATLKPLRRQPGRLALNRTSTGQRWHRYLNIQLKKADQWVSEAATHSEGYAFYCKVKGIQGILSGVLPRESPRQAAASGTVLDPRETPS